MNQHAPARLRLQHRAPRNIRKHVVRAGTRILVLAGSDLGTFLLLRLLIGQLRGGLFGTGLAAELSKLFPSGFLGGWHFAVALLFSLLLTGTYQSGDRRRDMDRVFSGAGLASLLSLFASAWDSPVLLIVGQFAGSTLVVGLSLVLTRLLVDAIVKRVRPQISKSRTVLVGPEDMNWVELGGTVRRLSELDIVGRLRIPPSLADTAEDGLSNLGSVIEELKADTVLIWGNLSDADFTTAVDVTLVSGCRLLTGPWTGTWPGIEPKTAWVDGIPLVELTGPSLRAWQLTVKRVVDLIGASIGLVVLAPVFVMVGVAIKLDSLGPVFFRQKRVGRAGRPFHIYKFRSMDADAESRRDELRDDNVYKDDRLFKVARDPRTTRLGRWLRKTSVDELPQLINVFKGEMSLVGPRPPVPSEVALYEERHYCRFDVRPGITGPWQVGGRNKILDFEEVIRLEVEYIRNWSFLKDLSILARTLPVVLRMDGAH